MIPRLDLSQVVNEFGPINQPVPSKKPRQQHERPPSGTSSVSGASKHLKSGKVVKKPVQFEEDDLQLDFSERSSRWGDGADVDGGGADVDLGDLELGEREPSLCDLKLGPRMSRKTTEEEEVVDDSLYAHNRRLLEERKANAVRCGPMSNGQQRLVAVAVVLLHAALLLFLWDVFEGRARKVSHHGWVSKEVRIFLAIFCLVSAVITCAYCMAFKSLQDTPKSQKEYGELAKILKKQHAEAKALGEQKINPDALRLAQKMMLHGAALAAADGKSSKKNRWLHQ